VTLRCSEGLPGEMNIGPRSRRRRRDEGDGAQEGSSAREDDNAERRRLRAEYRELQHSIQGVCTLCEGIVFVCHCFLSW
jgi:hypothetical protein